VPVCCISTLVRACRDHLKPGDYDHYTEAAENRVPPGSQTTRNVCLLARYGSDYKTAGASYPEMPSNRSHAVLARKREDCHHFYGGDEGGECASTESSALKPGRKFQNFFASGDKCKPKDCSYQGGKARCWKRVFCYMEPEAEAAPFVEAGGAPAGQCGKISAADLNWLWVTLGVLLGTIFVCGCARVAPTGAHRTRSRERAARPAPNEQQPDNEMIRELKSWKRGGAVESVPAPLISTHLSRSTKS